MNTLEGIIQNILSTYEEVGGVNHVLGSNLPSRFDIEQIIIDFEGIILPGYKTEEAVDSKRLCSLSKERIRRVFRKLSNEVTKSLCFKHRITETRGKEGLNCQQEAENITMEILSELPRIRSVIQKDVEAAFKGDPAAKSQEEVILAYPGVEAVIVHRIAHELWIRDIPLIPRIMSELIHGKSGIDIHPGANIGSSFFIDHATGVVIGETTVIGDNVKIYQGVTLGALSVRKELANTKRHPTIEDNVTIYSGATILGGETTIGTGSIIGGNIWLTASIPPYSRVYNKESELVIENNAKSTSQNPKK